MSGELQEKVNSRIEAYNAMCCDHNVFILFCRQDQPGADDAHNEFCQSRSYIVQLRAVR